MSRYFTASTDKVITSGTLTNSGTFTFAGWVKSAALASTVSCIWRDNAGAGATGAYIDSTNKLSAFLNSVQRNTTASLTAGIWYHFAMTGTVGSSVAWLLYVNGVLDTTTASINTPVAGGATTMFGNDTTPHVLSGNLADMAFWNVILNATQIANLANGSIRPSDSSLSSGLQGYWPLSGLSSPEPDKSGIGNAGQLHGTSSAAAPPALSWATGSRSFNGSSDYISLFSTINIPTPLTFSCWIYQNASATAGFIGGPTASGWEFRVETTGKLTLLDNNAYGYASSTGSISYTTWTHVALTYDGTNLIYYISGSASGSFTDTHSFVNERITVIGTGYGVSGDLWNGRLSDVAVWKTILNSSQIASLAAASVRPNALLPSSLVGYWPLNGSLSPEPDISGNLTFGNNGTVTGTIATSDHPSPWDRGARSFSASTDKVNATGTMTNSGTFTFAGWVQAVTGAGTVRCLWRDNAGAGATGAYIDSTNKLSAFLNSVQRDCSTAISTGVWYHFAFTGTIASSVAWLLYVNGVLDTTTASINTPIAGGATTNFGNDGSSQVLNGLLSDAAFWNIALSSGQIAALAAGTRPGVIAPGNLVGWWPLDGTTNPEQDLSGNGNTGTVTGTLPILGPPAVSRAMGSP
jgi:hypothetical protein